MILECFFTCHEIPTGTFDQRNHDFYYSFEITVDFKRQVSLPTHIQNIGRIIFDN
jgi:hypothetical protein